MRNFSVKVLRGIKANMPVLANGEFYLATDEVQLYIGTTSGNQLVLCNTLGTPTGSGGGVSSPKHNIGDPGPLNSQKIVTFVKISLHGTVYWIPLCQ